MADQEHLDILKQGAEVWNKWRNEHPEIRPDLDGANLTNANLTSVNLSGVDLSNADLNGADLDAANLIRANLKGAYLGWANLSRTDLDEADFTGSSVLVTIFGQVDLHLVKGLETVIHAGPSIIDIDTIYRSKGMISEVFLREAGVPDSFITYMRSLASSPIDYYTCFISYSSRDESFTKRLHADLQSNGVRCWFAPEDLKIGDKIRPRIDESIRLYDKLLIVLSEHSVASQWVEYEVETAIGKELEGKANVLFPVRLDNAVMDSKTGWASNIRLTRHIGDFTKWKRHDNYQKAFERLLHDLKAE